MFKNRKLTVSVDKVNKKQTEMVSDEESFEKKAEYVLHKLEGFAVKAFIGLCIYVVLDTQRQVAVAKTYNPK